MNLTQEQQHAITTPKSLAVIASAGTGKTTVLGLRLLHCHLSREIPLAQILAFTFTEKASREMKEKILAEGTMQPDELLSANISTIHAFCHRLLKQNAQHFALNPEFVIFDEQALSLWQEKNLSQFINDKINGEDPVFLELTKAYGYAQTLKAMRALLARDLLPLSPEEMTCLNTDGEVNSPLLTEFLRGQRQFQLVLLSTRIRHNVLTYDDLENLTLKLLHENETVRHELQNQFKIILVDEFQDVSPPQAEIIKMLFAPQVNELFIVGDPKQSIYRFRGADVNLFSDMAQTIEKSGGERLYLTHTFRTPQKVLKYFNMIFKEIFTQDIYQEATSENPRSGLVQTTAPQDDPANSAETHAQHAASIAKIIEELMAKHVPPHEITILFLARGAQPTYEQALREKNIPFTTDAKLLLLDIPLIAKLWHTLNFLAGLQDKITEAGMVKNPALIARWQSLTLTHNAAELIEAMASDLKPEMKPNEEWCLARFVRIFATLKNFSTLTGEDVRKIGTFLNHCQVPIDAPKSYTLGVRLLTIHGAKGLEFEHVFVVPGQPRANESPLFSHKKGEGFYFKKTDAGRETSLKYTLEESFAFAEVKSLEQKENAEEIKRLLYVAFTRTKNSLYIFTNSAPPLPLTRPEPAASTAWLATLSPKGRGEEAKGKRGKTISEIKSFNGWLSWLSTQANSAPSL